MSGYSLEHSVSGKILRLETDAKYGLGDVHFKIASMEGEQFKTYPQTYNSQQREEGVGGQDIRSPGELRVAYGEDLHRFGG